MSTSEATMGKPMAVKGTPTVLAVKKRSWGFLLIWPAFLYLLAFLIVVPFFYNIYQSLFSYSLLTGTSKFVGLQNFHDLFTQPDFYVALWNSLLILVISLVIETVLGVVIALMLNQDFRGKVLARILLILPLGTVPVVNGYLFSLIFFPNASPIDHIFNLLGLAHGTLDWLVHPWMARTVVIAVDAWQWTSFMVIMVLAGLSAVPKSYYELAKLDNMSSWRTFWRITLPKIKLTLALAMLIRAMDLLKYFDPVFAITKGGPQDATETASYYIYRFGFKAFVIGYASAGSLIIWTFIWVMSFLVISRVFSRSKEQIA
jgi:multiple sugar transport system permease protein